MDFASVLICQLLAVSACICFVISENVNTTCIRKCCPEGLILSAKTRSCESANEISGLPYDNVCLVHHETCNKPKVPVPIKKINFEILENDTLLYTFDNRSVLFTNNDYCLEFLDSTENLTALVCISPPKKVEKALLVGEKANASCVSKCCSQSSFWAEESQNCFEVNQTVKLPVNNVCPVHRNNCKNQVPLFLSSNTFKIENNFLNYVIENQSVYFSNDDYCVDQLKPKNLVALICAESPRRGIEHFSSSGDCVAKCCPHESVFSEGTKDCIAVEQIDRLPYNLCRAPRLDCQKGKLRAYIPQEKITILQNYTLVYTYSNQSAFFAKDDYCLEYNMEALEFFAFVCVEDPEHVIAEKTALTGMIISMPFLLATFIAYALLPDRNLHMKALMFYVINLMLSYLLLIIIQLSETAFSDGICTSMGYFCLFFFLVSFFWMNVICIDIWFAFSGLRGFSGSKKTAERKRFWIYCGYAWGMPVLHVLIVRLIDSKVAKNSPYRPGIGDGQCFLKRGYPELLYFYGPMALLITINIVFFAITAFKIRSIKKETSMLKKEDSKRHSYENDKQTFNLYLKLLFAMGVNWSMEIISWAVIWADKAPDAIWYLTDFCNAIYGVFIFFIFVFKRSIWKLLKKRYYSFIGKPHLAHSMTMTNTTRVTSYSTTNSSVHENPHGVNDTSTLTSEA